MADNYLERQRDLYEARKAAWEKSKKYKIKKRIQGNPSQNVARKGNAACPSLPEQPTTNTKIE